MLNHWRRLVNFCAFTLSLALLSCGGASSSPGDVVSCGAVDPRCVAACQPYVPKVDGAFDVCSDASVAACQSECSARIKALSTVCASVPISIDPCLGCPGPAAGDGCDQTTCTLVGREATCKYPVGDQAAQADCQRKAYPRRTVTCWANWNTVSKAKDACSAADLSAGANACGSVDPRCLSACHLPPPPTPDGAFDVCSDDSATSCLAECAARIKDVPTLCASCLLQDACVGCGDSVASNASCDNTKCTVTGREGMCSYPPNDQAARDNCLRKVEPRRTVTCKSSFRDPTLCSTLCPH